jgi:predicted transcriptional regulator
VTLAKFNKGEFTTVPSKSARKGLKPVLQTVYTWLCDFSDENMESYPSRKVLAEYSGVSIDTLDRSINELVELGLVKKTERYINNEQTTNIYQAQIVEKAVGNMRPPSRKNTTQNSTHITQPITTTNVVEETKVSLLKPLPSRTYGDPEVNQVIESFETIFGFKLSRMKQQRIAATHLIKAYGVDKTIGGIGAAAAIAGEEYAPQIASIEELWQKWGKLVNYYKKEGKKVAQTQSVNLDEL